jgi:alginate O-acetyltransferase complex protein AlgI
LGLMLGFNFPMNFDSPYRSQSIIEFWRRWHMTLSRFLRDYLYIPLGGNRVGRLMTSRNLFLVFLLGGLWHGAAWTFVVWGAYHGMLLVIEHLSGRTAERKVGVSGLARMLFTFLLVVIGWVFFRAESMGQALHMLQAMSGMGVIHSVSGLQPYLQPAFWMSFAMALLLVFRSVNSWQSSEQLSGAKKYLHLGLFLLALNEMFRQEFNPFLYFQF